MDSRNERENKRTYKCVSGLAMTQISIGIICFTFQVAIIAKRRTFIGLGLGQQLGVEVVGSGIWCGVMFIVTGALGVWSSKSKTPCSIVAFMVTSIVSAMFTVGIVVACTFALVVELAFYRRNGDRSDLTKTRIALNACLIALAVIEAVVAIISSARACHVLFSGKAMALVPGQVQYTQGANGQQSVNIIPANRHHSRQRRPDYN